jgi:hypothetical protein
VTSAADPLRPAQLVAALASVRARIADAAGSVGRDPLSITLVAVTKTFPVSDMEILLDLGVGDLGESRDQEAVAKMHSLRLPRNAETYERQAPPRLHFVGRLQTNKCRSVAGYAYCVHAVDRAAVATALAVGVDAGNRAPLPVFVQVSLDGDPHRGGVGVDGLDALADAVAADGRLRLRGVMAVAPIGASADASYARLAEISARLRESHPQAEAISAGMSGDFEVAVKKGATHVRIGSALLGRRDLTFS